MTRDERLRLFLAAIECDRQDMTPSKTGSPPTMNRWMTPRSSRRPRHEPHVGDDRGYVAGVLIWEPSGIFTVGQDGDR
jgi:hypothetical protein